MPPVPKDEADRNKKILVQILKLPHNKECADCTAKGPTWCPTNWGVYVCIRCAGIHRKMGTHISTVKSCTLDSWYDKEVELVKPAGNKIGKLLYEAGLNRPKPDESDDARVVEDFIRNKYEKKLWMRKGADNGTYGLAKLLQNNPDLLEQAGADAATPVTPSPLTPQADGPAQISYGSSTPAPKPKPAPAAESAAPKPRAKPAPVAAPVSNAPSLLEFDGGAQQTSVEALLVSSSPAPQAQQKPQQAAPQQMLFQQAPPQQQQFDIPQKSAKDSILDAFANAPPAQNMYGAPRPMGSGMLPPQPQRPMGMPPQGGYPPYGAPMGMPHQQPRPPMGMPQQPHYPAYPQHPNHPYPHQQPHYNVAPQPHGYHQYQQPPMGMQRPNYNQAPNNMQMGHNNPHLRAHGGYPNVPNQ